jgi:hypothetical protein
MIIFALPEARSYANDFGEPYCNEFTAIPGPIRSLLRVPLRADSVASNHLDPMRMMNLSVEDAVSQGGISDLFVPTRSR